MFLTLIFTLNLSVLPVTTIVSGILLFLLLNDYLPILSNFTFSLLFSFFPGSDVEEMNKSLRFGFWLCYLPYRSPPRCLEKHFDLFTALNWLNKVFRIWINQRTNTVPSQIHFKLHLVIFDTTYSNQLDYYPININTP